MSAFVCSDVLCLLRNREKFKRKDEEQLNSNNENIKKSMANKFNASNNILYHVRSSG